MKGQLFSKLASTLMLLGGLLWIQQAPASAQNFHQVQNLTGLTATLVSGTTYTLSLASGTGSFEYNGQTYSIDGVSLFMTLGSGDSTGDSTTQSGWQVGHLDGHAAGFSDDNGSGGFGSSDTYLKPGQTFGNFTFNSSSTNFGYHVLLDPGETINGSNTFFITAAPGPVPEPGFVQMAGLLTLSGVGTAFRKLKNRRSA